MTKRITWVTALSAAALISGCGSSDRVVPNNARLLSSSLAPALAPSSGRALRAAVAATACDDAATRCTPQNVTGDLCYAFLGLGQLGGDYFPMTWLAPESSFPDGPRSGTCSSVQFDLLASTSVTGRIKIPGAAGDMPASQAIIRAELMFNYVDVEVALPDPLAGTWTVRTVYATSATAPDVDGAMQKGDKLLRTAGEAAFRWCNASACSGRRDEVAAGIVQDRTVTDAVHPGQGNPDYVNVTANLYPEVPVSYGLLEDGSKTWTLDFSVTDAVVWAAPPATFTGEPSMLAAFRLKFGPNRSTTMGEADDGISGALTIE